MNIHEISPKTQENDTKFRNYVARMYQNGDKTRLCALLNLSYPTLMRHLTGVVSVPAVQAQIIDYFEKRNASVRRASQYIDKRLSQIEPQEIAEAFTPKDDENANG